MAQEGHRLVDAVCTAQAAHQLFHTLGTGLSGVDVATLDMGVFLTLLHMQGYRNVIGLPGGKSSPLFSILEVIKSCSPAVLGTITVILQCVVQLRI